MAKIRIITHGIYHTGLEIEYEVEKKGEVEEHSLFCNKYDTAELLKKYRVIKDYKENHGRIFVTADIIRTYKPFLHSTPETVFAEEVLTWDRFVNDFSFTESMASYLISRIEEEKKRHNVRFEMRAKRDAEAFDIFPALGRILFAKPTMQ